MTRKYHSSLDHLHNNKNILNLVKLLTAVVDTQFSSPSRAYHNTAWPWRIADITSHMPWQLITMDILTYWQYALYE